MSRTMEFRRGRGGYGTPITPMRQRGNRKRWLRRSLRTALVAAALLGGAVLAHAGWNFLCSDGAFGIRTIHVVGLTRHSPQVLRDALGDLNGRNLFALRVEEVSARFAAYPWLKGFLCRKHLPDTLIVEVVERDEICAVATEKGPFAVDGRDAAWPVPAGTPCAFTLGAGMDPADLRAQALVASLLSAGLSGTVKGLVASPVPGALALDSGDGWTLVVSPENLPAQWRRFQACRAFAATYAPGAKTMDLRWIGKTILLPAPTVKDGTPENLAGPEGGQANG